MSPYYDDFDTTDNFHRVLFRPGFAVQARELTQLQSILQNQIEKFGTHMFKEGAMVIPGQSGFTNEYYAVKLQSTFNSNPVSGYVSDYIGKTITGATSGVKATVIGYESATTTDPLTLYVKYTQLVQIIHPQHFLTMNKSKQTVSLVVSLQTHLLHNFRHLMQLQLVLLQILRKVYILFVVSLFVSLHKELFLTSIPIRHLIVLVFQSLKLINHPRNRY